MDLLNRVRAATGVVLSLAAAAPITAAAQFSYQRPTTAIVPVSMPANVSDALVRVCANGCAGSRWADRTFSDGLIANRIGGDTALLTKSQAAKLNAQLVSQGIVHTFILRQFLAEKDFGWRFDSAKARTAYSVSTVEAQKLVREVNGPEALDVVRTVPTSYVFAVTASDASAKPGKDILGNANVQASAKIWVSVFKLGYSDGNAVRTALDPYFCQPGCKDQAQRRARFVAYRPPLTFVQAYTAQVSGSGKDDAEAWKELGSDILEELVDATAAEVAAFAVQEKVIRDNPIAARIGMKEGVKRGARYYAYQSRETDGKVAQHRTGVVLANRVADNRKTAFTAGAVRASVSKVDSTTFKQVYPGDVGIGNTLVEKPSDLSWNIGVALLPGNTGLFVEVRDEGLLSGALKTPLGLKFLIGGKGFAYTDENDELNTVTIGSLGLGYELTPLKGRLRLMPLIAGGFGKSENNTSKLATDFYSFEYGAEAGLRLHPEYELTGSLRNISIGTVDAAGDVVYASDALLQFGLRIQRGRWGLF